MGFLSDDDNVEFSSGDDEESEYSPDDLKRIIVNYMSNIEKDKCISSLQRLPPNNKLAVKPILQSLINDEDKETCLRAIVQCLSDDKGTPLHYAADQASFVLIAALLDHGEDPNIRVDWNDNLKQALPLNVVLDLMARQIVASFQKGNPHRKFSAFKLICELCSSHWRASLECVRLLALQTKELNHEIINYTMEGKVIELCALMLLGYYTRVPSRVFIEMDDSTKEEQVLQLIETFARIGDKLQTYVTLKPSPFGHCIGGLISEIGSMFKDAGLPVCNKDNLIYNGKYDKDLVDKTKRELSSRVYRPGENDFSHMVRDVTLGSCSLHTSSVLKAHKVVMHSSQLKGFVLPKPQFWWNPSFLMMALRRVTRHV